MDIAKTGQECVFEIYKKHFRRKQLLWDALSITYTLVLIPLIRLLDGTDYSTLWKIVSTATSAALIVQNLKRSRAMKRQLEALSENTAEKISAELESCEQFRIFAFTSEYLFSKEGLILPYYEIDEVITKSYGIDPVATNIEFITKSFGKCIVTVGYGNMSKDFYNTLSRKCPLTVILFHINYQRADMEEYFDTIKAGSINVIRKKKSV